MKSEVLQGYPSFKVCAFCCNWYNPSNDGIEPGRAPRKWRWSLGFVLVRKKIYPSTMLHTNFRCLQPFPAK